jgi:hypothetical protein
MMESGSKFFVKDLATPIGILRSKRSLHSSALPKQEHYCYDANESRHTAKGQANLKHVLCKEGNKSREEGSKSA